MHSNDIGNAHVHVGIIKDVHEYDVGAHAHEHTDEHVGVDDFFLCLFFFTKESFSSHSSCEDNDALLLT